MPPWSQGWPPSSDYTVTPRRFTPGWELVLSKRSMALVYGAMAAGFWVTRA